MKHWHKILAVALLISLAGLMGDRAKSEANSQAEEQAETAPISEAALPVVLPENAEVILNEGNPKQGSLTQVSPEELTLTIGGQEISIATKDVNQVKFKGNIRFYSNGQLVIRGDGEINSQPKVWPNIPLTAFQVVEGTTGQATVNLIQSGLAKSDREAIVIVATTAGYLVEEIQFEQEGKVTLTVKPFLK